MSEKKSPLVPIFELNAILGIPNPLRIGDTTVVDRWNPVLQAWIEVTLYWDGMQYTSQLQEEKE